MLVPPPTISIPLLKENTLKRSERIQLEIESLPRQAGRKRKVLFLLYLMRLYRPKTVCVSWWTNLVMPCCGYDRLRSHPHTHTHTRARALMHTYMCDTEGSGCGVPAVLGCLLP